MGLSRIILVNFHCVWQVQHSLLVLEPSPVPALDWKLRTIGSSYIGWIQWLRRWSSTNGCRTELEDGLKLDVHLNLDGISLLGNKNPFDPVFWSLYFCLGVWRIFTMLEVMQKFQSVDFSLYCLLMQLFWGINGMFTKLD